MPGFSSVSGSTTIVSADNASFDGTPRGGAIATQGDFWIGTGSSPAIDVGTVVSPLGTLIIGYSGPNITIDVNTMGPVLININVQEGTTPVTGLAGTLTILGATVVAGTTPVYTYGNNANEYTTEVQISQAIASTNASNVGLAAFNSANFSVDSNGFVTAIGGGYGWVNVTGTTQAVVASAGYLSNNAGTVTFTLPATSTFGDVFRIVGNTGGWVLAQRANQTILFGSGTTTTGTGGSLASTNAGDCIELMATNTSASSTWRVENSIGNITIT
jgi:hypothetical protein